MAIGPGSGFEGASTDVMAHPDTDAQHKWLLEHLGLDTRKPAGGTGLAEGPESGQAASGSQPGTADEAPGPEEPAAADGSSGEVMASAAKPVLSDADKAKMMAAASGFADRFALIHKPGVSAPAGTFEVAKAVDVYVPAYNALVKPDAAVESAKVDAMIAKTDSALKALEQLVADLPKKLKAATDEAAKVNKMKDADLKKLSSADKAQMVKTLLAAGKPGGDTRKAQIKVYNAMQLDAAFLKQDEERGKQIAADLKGDKDLKAVRKGWGTASEADKLKALQKIVAVQSKHLGITPPEMVIEHQPADAATGLITNGYFSPADGKLHINMDVNSSVQQFTTAVDLAIHENAHNYQKQLADKLEAGQLKPGSAEYDQAMLFAVNGLEPGGYVPGKEDFAAYKKQPMEDHSHTTGKATASKIIKAL